MANGKRRSRWMLEHRRAVWDIGYGLKGRPDGEVDGPVAVVGAGVEVVGVLQPEGADQGAVADAQAEGMKGVFTWVIAYINGLEEVVGKDVEGEVLGQLLLELNGQ